MTTPTAQTSGRIKWSPFAANSGDRPTHIPLVPDSSPGGPTTSHRKHRVMALRPGDRNPLVHPVAGASAATDRAASIEVTGGGSRLGGHTILSRIFNNFYVMGIKTISTRRFNVRPSGVSFDATGCDSPMPCVTTRCGVTSCEVR